MTLEQDIVPDSKRTRIIEGAMRVFLAYGYQRTTMDDIARAADVSRPALYLLFRNKTDIYREIGAGLLENSIEMARIALDANAPFAERMTATIERSLIDMMRIFSQSPHGAEMFDMKNSLAGDLVASWRGRLTAHLAGAIGAQAAHEGTDLAARGLTAEALADVLLDGLEGMKMRTNDPDQQSRAALGLVRVIELALRA